MVMLLPLTRNFTSHCLSLPMCINGYWQCTAGGNPATMYVLISHLLFNHACLSLIVNDAIFNVIGVLFDHSTETGCLFLFPFLTYM